MGVPVVRPSKTPERISTRSFSARGVVMALCPGRRRSSSFCTSSVARGMPAGVPSTMTPTPAPWLSPNVVTENIRPNELPGTGPPSHARVMRCVLMAATHCSGDSTRMAIPSSLPSALRKRTAI